jgi:hypothetical protein
VVVLGEEFRFAPPETEVQPGMERIIIGVSEAIFSQDVLTRHRTEA